MNNLTKTLLIVWLTLLSGFNAGRSHYKMKKIVIDAGHGGVDPGALGRISKEKDLALQISLRLGRLVKKRMPGVEVVYTRTTDKFVPLHERAHIANKNNTDVFISIHCNSSLNKAAIGTETYTMGLHRSGSNLRVAKRENEVVLMEDDYKDNYSGFDPQAPESHVLLSLYQSAYNTNSVKLAGNIQKRFSLDLNTKNRSVKQAGLLVLYKTAAPSVLVEVGFITNRKEEKYLNSKAGQERIASSLFKSLQDYKSELEQNG